MIDHFPKQAGVYAIRHVGSGKVYIGSAQNLWRRGRDHVRMLRGGYHPNPHLQRAVLAYGLQSFRFEVIEIVHDLDALLIAEQRHLDEAGSANHDLGYNCRPLAASNRGRKASPQEVERNRLARLGKKQSPELIERRIAPRRGVPLTENHRRAISQGKLARKTRRPDIREWAPRKFARFEPTTVDVIRAEKAAGASYRMLAARYQCSVATLHRLVHGIGPLYSSHKPC